MRRVVRVIASIIDASRSSPDFPADFHLRLRYGPECLCTFRQSAWGRGRESEVAKQSQWNIWEHSCEVVRIAFLQNEPNSGPGPRKKMCKTKPMEQNGTSRSILAWSLKR